MTAGTIVLNNPALGRYIADTVREPLLVLNASFDVVAANHAYFTTFDASPGDTVAANLFELGERQWESAELRRLLKEVLPQHRRIEGFAVELLRPGLPTRSMLLNACEIVRPDEHEYLILLAIEDVSMRRGAELALALRTQELERSNRELEQFAAIASHDLHEPLRKVRTYGDLLLRSADALPTAQGREQVERMVHAATRMQSLINGLLELARVAAPQRFVSLDPAAIIADVLVDLDTTITSLGALVTVGPLPLVAGDPTLLRQVFQNLISNALKFRRDGVPPVVTIESFAVDGHDHSASPFRGICVVDNGIGFDGKYREVIFEPLERLHGRNEYAGSGMGLALVRRIVQRHGGTITAQSVSGEGSTFCFTLPVGRAQ